MKNVYIPTVLALFVPTFVGAQSDSYAETLLYSNVRGGVVESRIETSGNAEVHVRTVIDGEVVEDARVSGESSTSHVIEVRERKEGAGSLDVVRVERGGQSLDSVEEHAGTLVSQIKDELPIAHLFVRPVGSLLDSREKYAEPVDAVRTVFSIIGSFILKFF